MKIILKIAGSIGYVIGLILSYLIGRKKSHCLEMKLEKHLDRIKNDTSL